MLLMNMEQADRAVQDLERIKRKVQRNEEHLYEVARVLRREMENDSLHKKLDGQIEEMQELESNINLFSLVLQHACKCYQKAEIRTAEYMEETEGQHMESAFQTWQVPNWVFQLLR